MELNMLDVVLKEDNTIELPERVVKHLNIDSGDVIKVLFTEDAVILMNPGVFGEKLLKLI